MNRTPFAFITAAAVFATSVLLLSSAADATIMLALSIEQMTAKSRTVVRATVRQRQGVWDEKHQRIYTLTELTVSEVIRGEAPATIVVRSLGGEVDGIGMKVSGSPRFSPDQDVVVFLREDPVGRAGFMVVGMSQGLFRLEKDSAGRLMAVPGVEGMSFARRAAPGQGLADVNTDLVRLSYTDLRRRVAEASAPDRTPVPR